MHVYIIEGENLETFSTARKAIEKCVADGFGESQVYLSFNEATGKTKEFALKNVKRAISQLNQQGHISMTGGGLEDMKILTIVQRRVN